MRGTVPRAPKLTMSKAPHDPTYGTWVRAIASSRSGPAAITPPTIRSHTSVVVRSSTELIMPSSTSFSMALPPVPVAWKTSGSTASLAARPVASAMRSTTALTHGVVTPTSSGRPLAAQSPRESSGTRSLPARGPRCPVPAWISG